MYNFHYLFKSQNEYSCSLFKEKSSFSNNYHFEQKEGYLISHGMEHFTLRRETIQYALLCPYQNSHMKFCPL